MDIWNSIKKIFLRKEKKGLDEQFEKDTLVYTGEEPDCWACQLPIHDTQFSKRLQGRRMHRTCFRKIKKIALNGGGINDFAV